MDINMIKELISEFKDSDLTKLQFVYKDYELKLEREKEVRTERVEVAPTQIPVSQPIQQTVAKTEVNIVAENECAQKETINSPMVGTFYESATPGGEPFVKVGDQVKAGDVLCIIEAMKLMNEVEAEKEGKIVEILVKNEEMVEFDQPLFVIE